MCGVVAFLFVTLCIGGPAYIMYSIGHPYQAAVMVVVSLLVVYCANELGKPIR